MIMDELTTVEVDELIEKVSDYEARIAEAEAERDALIQRYQAKILKANELCDEKCASSRVEIALLTERLRRYASEHVTEKRRSLKYPSGTLSFRKQAPKFYFEDNREVDAKNEQLLEFVRANARDYLKVAEFVDWKGLKTKLKVEADKVFYAETGEEIEGMKAQVFPDTFTVKTI